jgi:hypothetical protein
MEGTLKRRVLPAGPPRFGCTSHTHTSSTPIIFAAPLHGGHRQLDHPGVEQRPYEGREVNPAAKVDEDKEFMTAKGGGTTNRTIGNATSKEEGW